MIHPLQYSHKMERENPGVKSFSCMLDAREREKDRKGNYNVTSIHYSREQRDTFSSFPFAPELPPFLIIICFVPFSCLLFSDYLVSTVELVTLMQKKNA